MKAHDVAFIRHPEQGKFHHAYPDHPVVTWDASQLGKAIFYHDRVLNERFLSTLT